MKKASDYKNPIELLAILFEGEEGNTYLIVDDLNLYHPIWSGARISIVYIAIDQLIEVIYK